MNPEIKALWLDALRNSDYQQANGRLRDDEDRFCCLGVLCDLAVHAGIGYWDKNEENRPDDVDRDGLRFVSAEDADDWAMAVLPDSVQTWAGLHEDADPTVSDPRPSSPGPIRLSNLNDEGWSFAGIADLIEREL